MKPVVSINGRPVGPGRPPYVVAEISANHNGDLERALQVLESAKASGAEAVKIQTYTPDTMTLDCDRPDFLIKGGLWDGRTLYDLYREAQTPLDWHGALFERAKAIGITMFSTPFDETAVDLLEELGAPAYKIASFEAIDLQLIARAARTGKPLIVSTGMANLDEIGDVIETAADNGCDELVLLHCVSGYPTPVPEANLRTLQDMRDRFGVPVGLSDHTLSPAVAVAAVSLGAVLIEKHFTLLRSDGGLDASFSIEPAELSNLVTATRDAHASLGQVNYERQESEKSTAVFRRSLYAVEDIAAGEVFTEKNVRSIRPAYGLPPKFLPEIIGTRATRALPRGTPLDWSAITPARGK